jgi:hypothetical protein
MSQAGIAKVTDQILPPDVPLEFVTNSGTATAIANVINILGVGGVTTSAPGSSNTIDINVVTTGFTWNVVTSVSPANPIQLVKQNGYSCQGVSLVTFILPLAPTFGDTFIVASTTSRFQINQNGSQQIQIGNAYSTAGSGNCTSNTVGDFIELVYMGSNLFQSFAPQGTLTLN